LRFPQKRVVLATCGPAALATASTAFLLWALTGCLAQSAEKTLPATRPVVVTAASKFHSTVEPILQARCYQCHAGADNHTPVAFDALKSDDISGNPELWLKVLRNTRSHIMPPRDQDQPTPEQQLALENWIEFSAFGVDPDHFDPGRQTIRRLNRTEYRNTIQDLVGVDFDVDTQFPPDDIGYGFDNIGDVLNVSPMLMEKYVQAAQTIVAQGIPLNPKVMPVQTVVGNRFSDSHPVTTPRNANSTDLSFYIDSTVTHTFKVPIEGDYTILLDWNVKGAFNFIPARCSINYSDDETDLSSAEHVWHDDFSGSDEIKVHWSAGKHPFNVTLHPTTLKPSGAGLLSFRILKVQVKGPQDEAGWSPAPAYKRFFPRDAIPTDPSQRREYARDVLRTFATRAFRRPVPDETLDRLTDIAQSVMDTSGGTFERGVAQAMVAVLASPRFLFRVESAEPAIAGNPFINVDEYSLASRLSYFLWSTTPDDELMNLAATGQLRQNLRAQVTRMLADQKSQAFVENFTSQWLQSREVTSVAINPHEVLLREGITVPVANNSVPGPIRQALLQEPDAVFAYIMHNDRSVKEFLASDYIFLNQTLADYYKIPGVTGPAMRKVDLSPGDLRGGALTMGATLMVTSNPTRTSPVKRGKWVLENILGAPTPPPPPDIPPLELAAKNITDKTPTLREILAAHRASPVCASCHDRMDPLGLSMENFNAEGLFRDKELDQPIDASGQLFTGETFKDVSDLKQALIKNHLPEFYRCLTEKMLTYATGRGMEYYDMPTIDKIADQLQQSDGRFSTLLLGIIDSAPFQQRRVK